MSDHGFYIQWEVPPSVIGEGLERAGKQFLRALDDEMNLMAMAIEKHVQSNHVWENRTGDAEKLYTVTAMDQGQLIEMSHGVYYGTFLESMRGGYFSAHQIGIEYAESVVTNYLMNALDTIAGWGY